MTTPESLKHLAKTGTRGAPGLLRSKLRFHALTRDQRIILRAKGFLPREIKEFDENTTVDFHSKPFQRMVRSRDKWRQAMKMNGWNDKEIDSRINKFLNRKKHSPWNFFRLEYAVISQRPVLSGSKFRTFLQERRDISAQFGRAYGRIQSVKKHFYKGLPGLPKKRK